tara:strand:- start:3522 stop:4001 length:480 start_codon:yes stop_codon:yes gene_type:complete
MTNHVVNLGVLEGFGPVLAFLIVFVVGFAVLKKSEILGDEAFANILVSFVIASVFTSFIGVRDLVLITIPWFAVLLMGLFFVMMFGGFIGKPADMVGKGVVWVFAGLLGLVFLISGFWIFQGSPLWNGFLNWAYGSSFGGTFILAIVASVVGWVLVKKG